MIIYKFANLYRFYEKASRQMINFDKLALTSSPNTSDQAVSEIKSVLSVEVVKGHDLKFGATFSLNNNRLQFSYIR